MAISLKSEHIPRATIERLATYLQVLDTMRKDGLEVISSEPLAKACEVNASQVRKDLAYFGEFGVRGVGYYVDFLYEAIKDCLHANREWRAALIGAGNLGKALLNHQEFRRRGLNIIAAFDSDPDKIGSSVYDIEILPPEKLGEKVAELGIELGIITTPPEFAQSAADMLCESGIRGILNFSATRILTPKSVITEHVNFFHQIYSLTFGITLAENTRA